MKKDLATPLGLAVSFGLVFFAMIGLFGPLTLIIQAIVAPIIPPLVIFIDLDSIAIVLGGTFGALLVNFKFNDIKKSISLSVQALTAPAQGDEAETIQQVVDLSQEARVNGLLALEPKIKQIESEFLRTGLEMVVDGTDPDEIRENMENELAYIQRRHLKGQQFFLQAGAYCPSFGMVGTLIGLVQMMTDLTDIDMIASSMQVALLTTFYGSLFANAIFLPLGGKLSIMTSNEVILKELMIEGVMSIPKGENPKVLKKYLNTFIAPKRRLQDA